MSVYISFDEYYTIEEYNLFLSAAKNNNVPFEEFIRIRSPFNRFLKIDEQNIPKFLNYDEATVADRRWLVSAVKPVQPNEAFMLKRKPGQDVSYSQFCVPGPLQNISDEKYIMVFKDWDKTRLNDISLKLGETKIYKLGTAEEKGFGIFVCFNPYIKGLVPKTRILLEYGKGTKNKIPESFAEIECELNYSILVKEKLINKTYELEYHSNGKFQPLQRKTFI